MWHDYYEQTGLDTIYVGASDCQRGLNPEILDEAAGFHSFNMATSAQSLELSYDAVKTAIHGHELKRIVLTLGYFSFEEDQNYAAEAVFLQSKKDYCSFGERLATDAEFIFARRHFTDISSLNYLVHWIYNNIGLSPADVADNMKVKLDRFLSGDRSDQYAGTAGYSPDINDGYGGKGYRYYNTVLDYDRLDSISTNNSYSGEVSEEKLGVMRRIVRLCEQNGVQLTVIAAPHPRYDVLCMGNGYFERMDMLAGFFADCGAEYYDFNMAKPEIFEYSENYFSDYEHLNHTGATAFSRSLGEFLARREAGEDMRGYFYTPEEFLASIETVAGVFTSLEQTGGGILIKANAFTGSGKTVEYQMCLVDSETGETVILRDYDFLPEYFWQPETVGTYTVRVCARCVGADIPYEHINEKTVSFG